MQRPAQQREVYAHGDYRRVSERLRPAAVELVRSAAIAPGWRVADVAAGDGNVAVEAAVAGAAVVALDITFEQIVLGRERTRDGAPLVRWAQADALALPIRARTCDAALSTFGCVYAPDPDTALSELVRVCRSGGVVGVTGWADGSFQAQAGAVLHEYLPRAAGYDPFAEWGREDVVRARAAALLDDVEVRRETIVMRFDSVEAYWADATVSAPPIATLRERETPERFAEFGARFRAVAAQHRVDTEDGIELRYEYLQLLGRAR